MNLEITADEESLVAEAIRTFDGIAPIARFRSDRPGSTWQSVVNAGWSDLGTSIEEGVLDLGAAGSVFRVAGRHLLVEQLVTSGYLLPAVIAHVVEDGGRPFLERLRSSPGILCGDGRTLELSVGEAAPGICFGVEEPSDLYRLTKDDRGRLLLGVADTDQLTEASAVADLAVGVGHVMPSQVAWLDAVLNLDAAGLARIGRHAMLLHSAALIGAADALLDITRDYTLNRVQFGVPIGSFQAVKHALADVFVSNEVAWSSLLCALADGADDQRRVLGARILTVEAALAAARAGAQYHGGIGFTWESDVHLYLKVLVDGTQRFGAIDDIAAVLGRSVEVAPSC
jgi:hypothetical protein